MLKWCLDIKISKQNQHDNGVINVTYYTSDIFIIN